MEKSTDQEDSPFYEEFPLLGTRHRYSNIYEQGQQQRQLCSQRAVSRQLWISLVRVRAIVKSYSTSYSKVINDFFFVQTRLSSTLQCCSMTWQPHPYNSFQGVAHHLHQVQLWWSLNRVTLKEPLEKHKVEVLL